MLSTDLVVSFGRSLNDCAKTSGHGQRRLAWVGPGVLTDNAYGAAPWPPARFMDEGGKGVASAHVDDRNKRVPPPPLPPPSLHHFQQQQLQQSSLHHQQQYKIYQQYRMRQQQQPSQKYPAEVIAAANAAAVVANSAALPSKLQHPLLQQSFPSSASSSLSITNNNGVVNGTAAAISAPYVDAADRSDSGLGSSRTLNSGDERSGSHSSAFSGSDELHAAAPSPLNDQHTALPQSAFNTAPVWRDPNMMQVCVQYPDREGFFSHLSKRLRERCCFNGRQQLLGSYRVFIGALDLNT